MRPYVDLKNYNNEWYSPGRSTLVQTLWFFLGLPFLRCRILPGSGFRGTLLRLFGARIGTGVTIKPGVVVKYPWHLSVGEYSWIGENVWIDNLTSVSIGSNVCISQGAYLCTGNHDWSDPHFGLLVKPLSLEDGCWVGTHSILCPGVTVHEGAVTSAGSVVMRDVPPFEVHCGNPASFVRKREMRETTSAMGIS